MRLAYLGQSYPPMISGAALVLGRLAEGMAARGHEVLVLAASDTGPAYGEQQGSLRVSRLRAWPNPFRVGQRFLLAPGAALTAELRAFQPDIVHVHDFSLSGRLGLQLGRALNAHTVLTLHQLPWFISTYLPAVPGLRALTEAVLWRYLRALAGLCTAVVTPSATIADIAAPHLSLRPTPLSNGVALDRFSPTPLILDEGAILRGRYGLDPHLPIILYVGRLDADKRVDLALRAGAEVMRTHPAQLLIVGDGKQRPALTRLSHELGLAGRCHFLGYVSDDLPGLYRLAAALITASEVEIQSSVVLEAAASSVPVVTVRASSMAEFVTEGGTGYLAAPGDVAGLAQHLCRILEQSPAERSAMRQAALALAQQHSIASALTAHEDFYQQMERIK
jgi:glycosyltransferase involved in cell wall biosynthesis